MRCCLAWRTASSPKSERDFRKSSFSHCNTEKSDSTVEIPGNSVAITPQNSARFWKLSLQTTRHASEKDDVVCIESIPCLQIVRNRCETYTSTCTAPQPAQWETYQQTSLVTTPAEEQHANDDNECSHPAGCWFWCLLKDVRVVCTQTESNHLNLLLQSLVRFIGAFSTVVCWVCRYYVPFGRRDFKVLRRRWRLNGRQAP